MCRRRGTVGGTAVTERAFSRGRRPTVHRHCWLRPALAGLLVASPEDLLPDLISDNSGHSGLTKMMPQDETKIQPTSLFAMANASISPIISLGNFGIDVLRRRCSLKCLEAWVIPSVEAKAVEMPPCHGWGEANRSASGPPPCNRARGGPCPHRRCATEALGEAGHGKRRQRRQSAK